jgi:hypothetical protein
MRRFGSRFFRQGNCAFREIGKNLSKTQDGGKDQACGVQLVLAPLKGEDSQRIDAFKKIAYGEPDHLEPCSDDFVLSTVNCDGFPPFHLRRKWERSRFLFILDILFYLLSGNKAK